MGTTPLAALSEKRELGDRESDWQRVRPKTRMRKNPGRSDVLVIKACGYTTYVNILRKVKSDSKLNVLRENIKNIRKTGKDELLWQFDKPSHQNTGDFRNSIKAALCVISEEVLIEIKEVLQKRMYMKRCV